MKKYFIVPGNFANAYDLVWTTDAGYYPDAEDYKRIRTIRDEAEEELKSVAAEFFEALETEGVDIADLSYGKSGPAGYFIKLQNGQYDESIITGRVQKALDEGSADCWTKKSAPQSLRHFAEETIVPLLEKAESTRKSNWKEFGSGTVHFFLR